MVSNDTYLRCRPHILAAIARNHGTYDEDDILRGLLAGDYVLWAGEKSAVVTEISEQPRMKVLDLFIAGGDLDELIDMEKGLEDYARANGCKLMCGGGRAGWGRVLPEYKAESKFFKVLS